VVVWKQLPVVVRRQQGQLLLVVVQGQQDLQHRQDLHRQL
jgi:hypothetical protein